MKSIFDRTFRYTSAAETDLRKTFKAAQRRIEAQKALARDEAEAHAINDAMNKAEVGAKVKPIGTKKAVGQ